MFCFKCGKTLDPSVSVCPDCGTEVVLTEGFESHTENIAEAGVNMLDGEPSPPTGFDLNGVKKVMNGKSILIDDSPLPGTVPAYRAAAPKPVTPPAFAQSPVEQPPVKAPTPPAAPAVTEPVAAVSESVANENPDSAKKKLDRSILILIIISVVLGMILVFLIFSIFFGKNLDLFKGRNKDKENTAITAVTDMMPEDGYVSITGTNEEETVGIIGESSDEKSENRKEENDDVNQGDAETTKSPIAEKITQDSAEKDPNLTVTVAPTDSNNNQSSAETVN